MAKRAKETKHVPVENRDRPQPVPVKVVPKARRVLPSKTPAADLIRQGISERSFI